MLYALPHVYVMWIRSSGRPTVRQLEGNKTQSHGLVVSFFFFPCLPLHSLVGTLGQVLTVAH